MNPRAALIAVIGVAIGCNSGTSVTITQLAAGSTECPNGGVQITVGGGEPKNVCNGAATNGTNGFTTLVVTTKLPNGDTNCPAGGARIDSGLDNGAGGGTANDGTLQSGEILDTDIICNGDTGARIGSLTPPTGPAGAFTIKANGGDTDGGVSQAGDGGPINIALSNGNDGGASFGGNVKLFRTGLADAGFSFPADPVPTLGAVPATVSANATIPAESTGTPGLAAGALFTFDGNLWQDTGGAGSPQVVTSLTVAASVTATFAMASCSSSLTLSFSDSVVNKGTITTGTVVLCTGAPRGPSGAAVVAPPPLQGGLSISCGDFFGASGSSITTAGAAGDASTAGGSAGPINVQTGSFWNKGNVLAAGGTGAPGGSASTIVIQSTGPAFNTGHIDASGGNSLSAAGSGGVAGGVQFVSDADLSNSGNVDTSGGTGSTGTNGGTIILMAGNNLSAGAPSGVVGGSAASRGGLGTGSLRNSGNLTARGADSLASCAGNCSAGSAGPITLRAAGGLLTSSGNLISTGGSVASSVGGGGSTIDIEVHAPSGGATSVPPGNLTLSGNLDVSGGWGNFGGGGGGSVNITLDASNAPNGQEVILYGYTGISTNGGSSAGNAGDAGAITVKNDIGAYASGNVSVPGGSVVNYCDLTAQGGVSTVNQGGPGGVVDIETQFGQWYPGPQFEMVFNTGAIDVSGGDGGSPAGNAGSVTLLGRDGAKNRGAITARGGNGTGNNASAGNGGRVGIAGPNGPADNGSTIDVSAGSAKGDASTGTGGQIQMIGDGAIDSGSLLAKGGAYVGGSTGGDGGSVQIASISGLSSITAPKPAGIDVSGGPASTQGIGGDVVVDGRIVTDSWTH